MQELLPFSKSYGEEVRRGKYLWVKEVLEKSCHEERLDVILEEYLKPVVPSNERLGELMWACPLCSDSGIEREGKKLSFGDKDLEGIEGYVNMLARWGVEDEKVLTESIAALRRESGHMKHLVEQLLFLARGDSGKTQLEFTRISLKDCMQEIYEESLLLLRRLNNNVFTCLNFHLLCWSTLRFGPC